MSPTLSALIRLGKDRLGRWTAVISFVALLAVYAAILPASFTGGYVGWISLRFLTPGLFGMSAVLAVLLSLTIATMVLLVRDGRRASKAAATGGALIALVTPLLCCSPLLPLGLGVLATVFPALPGVAPGYLQGFVAAHEITTLLVAIALSAVALRQNAHRLTHGPSCRVPAESAGKVQDFEHR